MLTRVPLNLQITIVLFSFRWPELVPEVDLGVWPRNPDGQLDGRMPFEKFFVKLIWVGLAVGVMQFARSL